MGAGRIRYQTKANLLDRHLQRMRPLPESRMGLPQLITMKPRDVHTNEVIATYGEGTGVKIR